MECLGSRKPKKREIFQVVYELRHKHKLKDLLQISSLKKSLYYYYLNNMNLINKHDSLDEIIIRIFKENKGRYGYRRIKHALFNDYGLIINHKYINKAMRKYGLVYKARKKRKYSSYKETIGTVVDNILNKNFKADNVNEKWATDITEFNIGDTKIYLSSIIDLYNSEIISYSIGTSPNMNMVLDMLEKTFINLPPNTHPILHSDQGWHYQNHEYQKRLKQRGIIQ